MIHCSNLTKDYKSFKKTGWLKLRRSKSAEVFRAVVRYPLNIYPFFIQAICTFLLPYAFINYFPSLLLFEKIGMTEGIVLFCCGILVSALMVALPVWLFSRGLRRYESGNG